MDNAPNGVFMIGVFDLFHVGHLRLIRRAAALGRLCVGVVCDEAVKKEKGTTRPVIGELDRVEIIKNIIGVDTAFIVPDFKIPEIILKEWDIIVIGEDQTHIRNLSDLPLGKRYDLKRTIGISTGDIIKKIKGE